MQYQLHLWGVSYYIQKLPNCIHQSGKDYIATEQKIQTNSEPFHEWLTFQSESKSTATTRPGSQERSRENIPGTAGLYHLNIRTKVQANLLFLNNSWTI